jgi:hypothetical protein
MHAPFAKIKREATSFDRRQFPCHHGSNFFYESNFKKTPRQKRDGFERFMQIKLHTFLDFFN